MKYHIILFAAACLAGTAFAAAPDHAKPGWKLVWSDEFNTAGAPDPAKWTYETGKVRNNEAQLYTNDRRENVRVENGCLVIEARKERVELPGKPGSYADYTAGSIQTRGKFDWLYGRIEVKAKLPAGRGMWPAIWMMPTDGSAGWPACGEIDIMENVGYEPDTIHGTVHTKAFNHVIHTQKGSITKTEKPCETFHIYAIEWDEAKIAFFVDDLCYFTFHKDGKGAETWPFDKPFYLKLNTAIGGSWGGAKGIDDSIFPQKFLIDSVRVFRRVVP